MTAWLLHRIVQMPQERVNSNFNTLKEILDTDPNDILTFDGVYTSVHEARFYLKGRKIILFPCGDHIGRDNSFDQGQPPGQFCDWNQIMEIVDVTGAQLGWHSRSHTSFKYLSDRDIEEELRCPYPAKHMAYPYGDVDKNIAELTKAAGFEFGWSVTQGDGTQFQLKRRYLNW